MQIHFDLVYDKMSSSNSHSKTTSLESSLVITRTKFTTPRPIITWGSVAAMASISIWFIISSIWLVLNLSVHVPRPCLYMLGSPSRTLVFACVSRPCLYMLGLKTPVVCERRVYHTRSSRGVSKRRTFLTVHTKEEHIIILILSERDHLIMLPQRSWS